MMIQSLSSIIALALPRTIPARALSSFSRNTVGRDRKAATRLSSLAGSSPPRPRSGQRQRCALVPAVHIAAQPQPLLGLSLTFAFLQVFFSSSGQIARLIESMSRDVDAGSFNITPDRAHGHAGHSASSSLDMRWTLEERLEHMLGTVSSNP